MRVGLDARKLYDFGIGTHIQGLLGEFAALGVPEELVVYAPPDGGRPAALAEARGLAWRTESAPPYSLAELWRLALAARRDRVQVFHAPHYVCPPLLPCPAVVTIHDLIHLRFPTHRSLLAPIYARVMLRLAVRRAARLITVSESTRRDLAERLGARPEQVRVIPNGVAPQFRPAADPAAVAAELAALGATPPYLLFVGNPLPHKNLPRLLEAFAMLPVEVGRLVVAGVGPAARPVVAAAIEARGLGARVLVFAPLGADVLPRLYQGATALVCPSLWEGFGLPALEAMACGTPVLAADRGGLAEVVGDAGVLVDPTNVDALREGMYNLAVQEPLRAALRAAGLARARAFSWRQAADATVGVYREALAGGSGSHG
ncbi:MAG TPA: glycosyltransferase family 1 protein [Methylomirabilota bacterium]|nr:glycosyltransferase family 1 protein [Methylomirabilota bacterium]